MPWRQVAQTSMPAGPIILAMTALEGEQEEKDSKEQSLGVNGWRPQPGGTLSLRGLTPLESQWTSWWSGAGSIWVCLQRMAITNAILFTCPPCDLYTIPASHRRLGPMMWLRCAGSDFTIYSIFQSVYEICQWDSPGYEGRTPHWTTLCFTLPFVNYVLGSPFEFPNLFTC